MAQRRDDDASRVRRRILAGGLVAVAVPVLWGMSALLGWPAGVRAVLMWTSIALLAVLLGSMTVLPLVTRSTRRDLPRTPSVSGENDARTATHPAKDHPA